MARLLLDYLAWTGRWRGRSTAEKCVLALGLLFVGVSVPTPWMGAFVAAITVTIALCVARLPVSGYLKMVAAPGVFVLIGALTIAFSFGNHPDVLWRWGFLTVTQQSLASSILVSMRALAAVSAMILLAATTPMIDILTGMRRLRVPDTLIDIAALIYRMIFSLLDAASTIRQAQAARLGYIDARRARRSIALLAAAMLRRAWVNAKRLEEGLAGRGYVNALTTLPQLRPVSRPFLLTSIALIAGLSTLSIWVAIK